MNVSASIDTVAIAGFGGVISRSLVKENLPLTIEKKRGFVDKYLFANKIFKQRSIHLV